MTFILGFPCSSAGKESAYSGGDLGSILGLGGSHGEIKHPLWYACLENPMDRGIWQITVYGVAGVRNDLEIKPQPQSTRIKWVFSPFLSSPSSLSLSLTSTNSGIFYSVGFNSLMSLFILMLKLQRVWPVACLSSWLLCPYDKPLSFLFLHFLLILCHKML